MNRNVRGIVKLFAYLATVFGVSVFSVHGASVGDSAYASDSSTDMSSSLQPVIVTPSDRDFEPSRKATVLSEAALRRAAPTTVTDVLRLVPGIEVLRQGGVGQTTSVFIRGARSEDTLVLIDGVEANDAMSPGCGFDFSSLSPDNIERIEVFRGPQSVQFGAGATGGVINIVTKDGSGPTSLKWSGELGSYQTTRAAIGVHGKPDDIAYSVSVETFQFAGFSAASEKSGATELDGSKWFATSFKTTWTASPASSVTASYRRADVETELDRGGGAANDDPNNLSRALQSVAGLSTKTRWMENRLRTTAGIYLSSVERKTRNEPDNQSTTDSFDNFESTNRKAEFETDAVIGDNHRLRVGLQFRDESGQADSAFGGAPTVISRQSQSTVGKSLTYFYETLDTFFDVGIRHDRTSVAGGKESYRIALGHDLALGETKIAKVSASLGTGFKLPSLYQLYSVYGDQTLQSENSETIEVSIEKPIRFDENSSLTFDLTAYQSRFKDLIDYNMSTNKYYNVARASNLGAELESRFENGSFMWILGYVYLESHDESTGLGLLRRPQHGMSTTVGLKFENSETSVQYRIRGARPDIDPVTFARTTAEMYDVVDIVHSQILTNDIRLRARIENVFNREYEEVLGYGTSRLSFYLGISGTL